MTWHNLGQWWLSELASDPAYHEEVGPLVLRLLDPESDLLYLDLGCGQGRLMEEVRKHGATVVGCDLNPLLLNLAREAGHVVRANLPDLGWARRDAFDGAYVGLVLEHLVDEAEFFSQVGAVVRSGGVLAMVVNHPIWTAPESSPIEDDGGEILWRPGTYFGRGYSDEPADDQTVRFYHRTVAELLTSASRAGWDLQQMEEYGLSPAHVERVPDLAGQEQIPRVLGVRWSKR